MSGEAITFIICAAVPCAIIAGVLGLRWAERHQHGRHITQTPGGGVSPRAAAGSAPGGEDGLHERAGVLPAGRARHLPTEVERTAMFAQLAPQCPRCGGPHYEDECDATVPAWPSGMPLPAPADMLGVTKGMGLAGQLGTVQPWEDAPEPVVVEPAMTPLPEDERRPAYDWLYRDEPQPQQRGQDWTESDQALCLCHLGPDVPGEPITSERDCPAHGEPELDREALETGTIISGPGPDGWRELPDGCRLCDSEGHVTTGHDLVTATEWQATAATRQATALVAGVMMLARLAATRPALPRLGSLDHLEQRLWTTDTGTLPAICGADDLGGA